MATDPTSRSPAIPGVVPTPVPTPATPTPAPAPTTLSTADQSARTSLTAFLGQYGLADLGTFAWDEYLKGVPVEQILLDIRGTDTYKQRFPAMDELAKAGHALTESQYVSYETTIQQLNNQYGIPKGLYDTPDAIAKLLTGNVSASEYDKRLQLYAADAYNAPAEVKQAMNDLYGVQGQGNLVAFYADPHNALPELERQFNAAQIAGQATISGFGHLARDQAERLADLGVSQSSAQQGFTNLASLGDVTGMNEAGETPLTEDQLLAAQFGGDAAVQKQIRDRQAARLAAFQGGGQFATNSSGYGGIGAAK